MFATRFLARWAAVLPVALLLSLSAHADSKTYGDYTVHYNVFNSTFIDPDIAEVYDLVRARDLALINISVTRHDGDETSYGIPARVTGQATNLLQQSQPLEFQEISEGDATYYLASLRHTHEETFNLSIQVQLDSQKTPFEVSFPRKLYVEGR